MDQRPIGQLMSIARPIGRLSRSSSVDSILADLFRALATHVDMAIDDQHALGDTTSVMSFEWKPDITQSDPDVERKLVGSMRTY